MKKLTFLLILTFSLCFFTPSKAQFNTYHPFPHNNASWCQTDQWLDQSLICTVEPDNVIIDYYDYYVNGDTVVNSKTYFKVRTSGGYEFGTYCTPPYDNDYDNLAGLLREDTAAKKVYISFRGRDTLLYDFSLSLGNLLPGGYISGYDSAYVYSIDSILVGGNYRKQFIISFSKRQGGSFDSIVEGIGSMYGLLEKIVPPFEAGSRMDGFMNGPIIFPAGDTCKRYYLSVENIEKPMADISVYPNPSTGKFTMEIINRESPSKGTIEVYNVLGEKVYSTPSTPSPFGEGWVRVIDLSTQPNGIYLYRVITENGELVGEGKLVIQK